MPDWLLALLGALAGLLAGGGGLALWQALRGSQQAPAAPQPPPPAPVPPEVLESSRSVLEAAAAAGHVEVVEALADDDPEGAVADLLNGRHP